MLICRFFLLVSRQADKTDPDKTCRQNGTAEGAPVCSGRGECVCGVCVCDQQREGVLLTGQFCETVLAEEYNSMKSFFTQECSSK